MESSISSENTTTIRNLLNERLAGKISFTCLMTLIIPSVVCSCFIFYQCTQIRALRESLKNHLILCVLTISFIQVISELPFTLYYYYSEQVAFKSDTFCQFWITLNFSLNVAGFHLNAYLSVERYLLIFHHRLLNRYKVILHYIPMCTLAIFGLPYSFVLVVFFPCTQAFAFDIQLCGGACYELDPFWGTFDWVITALGPLSMIIACNSFLVSRVLLQRRRMQQRHVWKKNMGMLIQLLLMTALHCVAWLPVCIVGVISLLEVPPPVVVQELQKYWMLFSPIYLAVLGCPFVCTFALPELRVKIHNVIHRQPFIIRSRRVQPCPVIIDAINPA